MLLYHLNHSRIVCNNDNWKEMCLEFRKPPEEFFWGGFKMDKQWLACTFLLNIYISLLYESVYNYVTLLIHNYKS